ncbi:helix-turn-helix domain-containing protein [Flavobacterium sp. KACC 22763]|uniref:helix-turn-helix domain-containing protein n=1 Tax=Flavobacterium sp. KACC 22763 TaxID=3025668 RepID=UPI002366634B|nr:helix-turn-helix domain-containing protein [Flavobacterium sp. KACC 22763]WDF66196.1 helix-turn-helix domain-containing protein [Flavobacterium sp. KACC 22763]
MGSNIRIAKICQFCNSEFTAKTIKTKFCSLACGSKNYKKRNSEKRKEARGQKMESMRNGGIEKLEKLEIFTIDQASLLMGISRRTLYRVISRNEIAIRKVGAKTFINRPEIDKFFERLYESRKNEETVQRFPGIEHCYTISEIQKKLNISPAALYGILLRAKIEKYNVGRFVYVSKRDIELLFNIQSHE